MDEKMLRFTISEVNNMLNTEYNMISFDSLSRNAMLQIYADCLHKLDTLPKIDVEKNTKEALAEILEIVANINMPLPSGVKMNEYTEGIIQGKRSIMHYTLHWILSNQDAVKKRAYFSKYLKKISLPLHLMSDNDIEQIIAQYENVIQEFKNVHADNAKYLKMGTETLELRKVTDKINNNLTKVVDQIEKQKVKLENIPNSNSLFVSNKVFRNEIQQEKYLETQLEDQTRLVLQLENQAKTIKDNFKSQKALHSDPSDLLKKKQEEVQSNRIIAQVRLPQEYAHIKSNTDLITSVVTESPLNDDEISDLQNMVENLSLEIQSIINKTCLSDNLPDDKLGQFRQHAALISNNKQTLTNSIMEQKDELNLVKQQVQQKEIMLQQIIGGTMPQGDDLKRFVSKLRARSNVYKEHRAQLLDVQAEVGILMRTKDVLLKQNIYLVDAIKTKTNEIPDEQPTIPDNISELRRDSKEVAMQLNKFSTAHTLLRQELQNLKHDNESLTKTHQQAKEVYDSSISNMNTDIVKLKNALDKMNKTIETEENKWKTIKVSIEKKEEILKKLNEPLDANNGGKKHLKEFLSEKINAQDTIKGQLESLMQRTILEKEEREKQVLLWHSTLNLLSCKKECNDNWL